jgi:hypothetical protein
MAWSAAAAVIAGIVTSAIFGWLNRGSAVSGTAWASGGLSSALPEVSLLPFPAVGFLISRKRPENWIGWILLGSASRSPSRQLVRGLRVADAPADAGWRV